MAAKLTGMQDSATRIIETSRGPVEFSDSGEGIPILYFHGVGVGGELFLRVEQPLVEDGFRLLIPNRPGYYGTPISCGKTLVDCVDLAAELIEFLGIPDVAVMGSSGGGFFALAFAARHHGKTKCLVLACANTHHWDESRWLPKDSRWTLPLLRRPFLRRWLLRSYRLQMRFTRARTYLKRSSGRRFADVQTNESALELCRTSLSSMAECLRQPAGFDNDFRILLHEQAMQPGAVSCPTLVIHDELDPVAPVEHAEWAVANIPGAEHCNVRAAGHLIWVGRDADEMHRRRVEFLRRHVQTDGATFDHRRD